MSKLIELDNIKLIKSSSEPLLGGYFGFQFKYQSWLDFEEDIILYCEDRKKYLIEGLTHELTEMTIKKLLLEFIGLNDYEISYNFTTKNIHFKAYHLATVLSLPYYGIQLEYKEDYEDMLKYKIYLSIRERKNKNG